VTAFLLSLLIYSPTFFHSKRSLLARGKSVDAKNNTDLKTFASPHSTATNDHELTSRASLQFLKDNNLDLSMIDEKVVVFISFIIFMVVEEAIFLPLKADLINLLPSSSKLVSAFLCSHFSNYLCCFVS